MANIDISSKLSHEPQTITIAEGKTYEVDCGAETMLKVQDLFKKDDSLDGLFKAIELLLGKEALEETSVPSKYHEEILDTIERCLLNNTKEYFQPKGTRVSSNFSCSFFN